jgi:hypothetical protein
MEQTVEEARGLAEIESGTVQAMRWIAERLRMGCRGYAAWLPGRAGKERRSRAGGGRLPKI